MSGQRDVDQTLLVGERKKDQLEREITQLQQQLTQVMEALATQQQAIELLKPLLPQPDKTPPKPACYEHKDPGVVNLMDATGEQVAALLERAERFIEYVCALFDNSLREVIKPCWRQHDDVVFTVIMLERWWSGAFTGNDTTAGINFTAHLNAARDYWHTSPMATCDPERGHNNPPRNRPTRVTGRRARYQPQNWYYGFTWPLLDDANQPWAPLPDTTGDDEFGEDDGQ